MIIQKAIDGLYHALADVRDLGMVGMICRTLDKLQCMSNAEIKECNLTLVEK